MTYIYSTPRDVKTPSVNNNKANLITSKRAGYIIFASKISKTRRAAGSVATRIVYINFGGFTYSQKLYLRDNNGSIKSVVQSLLLLPHMYIGTKIRKPDD